LLSLEIVIESLHRPATTVGRTPNRYFQSPPNKVEHAGKYKHLYEERMKMMKAMKHMALALVVVMPTTTLLAAEGTPNRGKAREAVVKAYDANKNGKLDEEERAAIL